MKKLKINCAVFLLVASFTAGCAESPKAGSASAAEATNAVTAETSKDQAQKQIFEVKGVIQKFDLEKKQVTIKHEEIPNYMPAMVMPFDVKNTNQLAGLKPGDEVRFKMIVTEKDGWIDDISKTGGEEEVERPPVRVARTVDELKVGDKMPDYIFTNTLGKKVSLSGFKGQALGITFIFTRCPYPNFCPKMTSNFAEAQKLLKLETNASTNWHLLTISFDPYYDTPQKLGSYARIYGADPKKWDFVTGAMIDIDAISDNFGLTFAYKDKAYEHNLRTAVIDAEGKVQRVYIGNEWTARQFVDEMVKAAKK